MEYSVFYIKFDLNFMNTKIDINKNPIFEQILWELFSELRG